jgi:hypothetical protein
VAGRRQGTKAGDGNATNLHVASQMDASGPEPQRDFYELIGATPALTLPSHPALVGDL